MILVRKHTVWFVWNQKPVHLERDMESFEKSSQDKKNEN